MREQVPLPDSSYRPQRPEEAAALARPRGPRITAAPDADADAVRAALAGIAHADLADVDVHVSRGRASLDGSVARDQDRVRIVDALQALHLEIDDELRIRDP